MRTACWKLPLEVWLLTAILLLAGLCKLLEPPIERYLEARRAHRLFDSGAMVQERRIYNACQAYASIRGSMPASLDDLVPDFLPDPDALRDPDHPKAGEIGYRYYASGSTGTEPPSAIFLATKAIVQGGELIIRFNGKSDFVPPTDPVAPTP